MKQTINKILTVHKTFLQRLKINLLKFISKCNFLVEALWYMCSEFCQGSRLDSVSCCGLVKERLCTNYYSVSSPSVWHDQMVDKALYLHESTVFLHSVNR